MRKRKRDSNNDKSLTPTKVAKNNENVDKTEKKPLIKTKRKPRTVNPVANWNKIKETITPSNPSPKNLASQNDLQQLKPKKIVEIKPNKQDIIEDKPLKAQIPTWDFENKELTKYLALDCEMVGVGINGLESILARVCIVNSHGAVLYDEYVSSPERVVDFRTKYSGIRPKHLHSSRSKPFKDVQKEVSDIIDNRIVVGHSLENDFKALMLNHAFLLRRDTAKYRPFQRAKSKPHALRHLVKAIFGLEIQSGEHDPAEDARSALMLYMHVKKEWEQYIKKVQMKKLKKKK